MIKKVPKKPTKITRKAGEPEKKKKRTRSQLVKELDTVFSWFIRRRDCKGKGWMHCFCCGQRVEYEKAHNMHFISRAVYRFRWDETNCHGGCYRCNIALSGNYIEYTRNMITMYGMDYVDYLREARYEIFKISVIELQEKIDYYKQKVLELNKKSRNAN